MKRTAKEEGFIEMIIIPNETKPDVALMAGFLLNLILASIEKTNFVQLFIDLSGKSGSTFEHFAETKLVPYQKMLTKLADFLPDRKEEAIDYLFNTWIPSSERNYLIRDIKKAMDRYSSSLANKEFAAKYKIVPEPAAKLQWVSSIFSMSILFCDELYSYKQFTEFNNPICVTKANNNYAIGRKSKDEEKKYCTIIYFFQQKNAESEPTERGENRPKGLAGNIVTATRRQGLLPENIPAN